jgi:hypothetical protein
LDALGFSALPSIGASASGACMHGNDTGIDTHTSFTQAQTPAASARAKEKREKKREREQERSQANALAEGGGMAHR